MKRQLTFILLFIISRCSIAQEAPKELFQQQLLSYNSRSMQEKLFVHTDKTFYIAGETVWFKIYSVDASFHRPFYASSIAYIELVNRELKPVVQTKTELVQGTGTGSFTIPASIGNGNYIFRAYTSWMKNFPAEYYYTQMLSVVNTLRTTANEILPNPAPDIQFFPEGGSSVADIKNKIAFKVTSPDGNGADCNGIVVNQNNDSITKFSSFHNGMGSFIFKPEKNQHYYAIVRTKDTLIRQKLKDSENSGFVMNILNVQSKKISVSIQSSSEYENTNIYLISHTRQIVKNVQVSVITNGSATFVIDREILGDGISCITLFNNQREPVCERLVFNLPKDTMTIAAKTDQSSYSTRSRVNVHVATENAIHESLPGNLSLSVFLLDSFQHVPTENIVNFLYLTSDLIGKIQSPEYYFNNSDKASGEALNNLLLTQGWRRFKWLDVTSKADPAFEFLPEIEGMVVNAKIVRKSDGTPVPNATAFLSFPGADYAFTSATSNAQGSVRFGVKYIYKNSLMVVQPESSKDSNRRIDLANSYSDKFCPQPMPEFPISNTQEVSLLNRSISSQVENIYVPYKKHRYVIGNLDSTSFYGKPDKLYYLDNYVRFQTMDEVMREFVEDVRVRKDGSNYSFKLRNYLFGTYFDGDPLILLDGIPITGAAKIIALDPLKIKKIELIIHKYYLGSSIFDGIMNVTSYSGDLGASQIDPNALVFEFEGLQRQREFYSPEYTTPEQSKDHIPDMRNVLDWVPVIKTGLNGKSDISFYTSDLKGKFAVLIQGISDNGQSGSSVAVFDVNSPN